MMSSGVLPQLGGIISSGKEANVYTGVFSPQARDALRNNSGQQTISEEDSEDENEDIHPDEDEYDEDCEKEDEDLVDCAVKVFRTSLNEFKQREMYIRDDFRFNLRMNRSNPRKFITLWAEKEMHNLYRLQRAGIRSPKVLLYNKHILIMHLIGKQGRPAPRLHEVVDRLSATKLASLYRECLRMMRSMYQEAQLVHADLSAYNILYYNGKLWFIDVSQAVVTSHIHAHEFLLRDCQNVASFFLSHGVPSALTPLEMVAYITFHPGRFARTLSPGDESQVMDDDNDEEWSDVDSASVTSSVAGQDGQRGRQGRERPRRTFDTLDFAKEEAFMEQIKRDVAALAASHPSGVDPIQNASELLTYLLPTIDRAQTDQVDDETKFPGSHLNTASYRSADDQASEDDSGDDEEGDEDLVSAESSIDPRLVAHMTTATLSGKAQPTGRASR